jgi:hypothetical protein
VGRWCGIIVLNEHASTEDETFYEELKQVLHLFSKHRIKILLGDFNEKLETETIFKTAIENKSLHEDSNNNGVRVVNFTTSKDLVVNSTMFPHRNIHKYTYTSPDKEDSQSDWITC